MDGGGIVFDRSGEVRPGIEEACEYSVVFCEELGDCWQTEEILGGLMTKQFNGGGIGITCDDKSLLFQLVFLLLKQRLSRVVFCEYLDDCWLTEDSWGGLMT